MFTLLVTASDGPVPVDTTVKVRWSAGEEPSFQLDDPSTWKTLEQGSNLVCSVDPGAPPTELTTLECALWTSGATEVEISSTGYLTHEQTYAPKFADHCDDPIPSDISVELMRDLDAGVP